MKDLGIVKPGTTIYVPFATYDSNDPSASVTITGLATTDIEIYKDGSTTQRASDSGYTLLDTDGIDFDGVTGIHGVSIDLADNTTAGFWAAGSQYTVVIASITVDAATINFIPVTFTIGYPDAVINTTIATLSSQTSFTLTSGPAEDDALNGCVVCIHDVASAVQLGFGVVSDYTGSTKTVTLAAGVSFTAAATDNISIFVPVNAALVGGQTVGLSSDNRLQVDVAEWNDIPLSTTNPLPNSAADAAGGLPISDAGGLDLDTLLGYLTAAVATSAELAKVPKSDGTTSWNATALAAINAEADTALADYDAPTKAEMDSAFAALNDLDAAGIRSAVGLAAANLDTQLAAIAGYIDTEIAAIQSALATAQLDLDVITGSDGATLATAQGNYAPAKAGDQMDLVNAPNSTAITAIQSGLATLAKLLDYVQLLARSDAAIATDNATALNEINADEGSGAGDFDNTADAQEAIRDRGDAAWTSGSGSGLTPLATGTAQGGTASTIQLASGETFGDDILNGNIVKITSGTGAGQSRVITDYTGSTDTAAVTPNWTTNPSSDSVYEIVEGPDGSGSGLVVGSLNAAAIAQLAGITVSIAQPFRGTATPLELVQGDDYSSDDGEEITFTITGLDAAFDVTGASATLTLVKGSTEVSITATSVTKPASDVICVFEPTAAETALLTPATDDWRYDVQITLASGNKVTPIRKAKATVYPSYSD